MDLKLINDVTKLTEMSNQIFEMYIFMDLESIGIVLKLTKM
jgi:hypothetical protein